jgi:hypothetical protein
MCLYPQSTGNKVQGNAIRANGSDGVNISGDGNTIDGGNLIFANGGSGVEVQSSGQGNSILSNQIFGNAGLGIDLGTSGLTLNDPDNGANNLQNFPVITSAIRSNTTGLTTITGTIKQQPRSAVDDPVLRSRRGPFQPRRGTDLPRTDDR